MRIIASVLMLATLVAIAALAGPARVQAQQAVEPTLPDSVAERLVTFYNDDSTTRLTGDARIGASTTLAGGLAVLGGTLTLEGVIDGDVVVINGDLVLRGPVARVNGAVIVAGGEVRVEPTGLTAPVTAGVRVYREPLRYRQEAGRIVRITALGEAGLAAGRDFGFGRTDLLIAAHGAYNRVEGLPVAIGPRIRIGDTHPVTARAVLIARSAVAAELDLGRFGYDIRAEQLVAPALGLSIGARLYSEVAAIEDWGLSDRETALATFLLHQDFRDHYERDGWAAYARLDVPGTRYRVGLTYRDENHTATAPADPFTLLHRSRAWRLQPYVAEGVLQSITFDGVYDTRNEERDPSAGWLIGAAIEQGLGGRFADEAIPARTGFRTAEVDVRRYARLSPYTRLGLRVFGVASLDARSLPPQRQHSLGGEGALPGYRAFEFDCGARESIIQVGATLHYPYYGCDQVALVQVEYQASFPFARRIAESLGLSGSIGQLVRWVAFFDAGRAWIEPAARHGRSGGSDDFAADAGLGLRFGPLGAYWAVPLSGSGRDYNFFIRLGPRL
jgi:hypothetical protein